MASENLSGTHRFPVFFNNNSLSFRIVFPKPWNHGVLWFHAESTQLAAFIWSILAPRLLRSKKITPLKSAWCSPNNSYIESFRFVGFRMCSSPPRLFLQTTPKLYPPWSWLQLVYPSTWSVIRRFWLRSKIIIGWLFWTFFLLLIFLFHWLGKLRRLFRCWDEQMTEQPIKQDTILYQCIWWHWWGTVLKRARSHCLVGKTVIAEKDSTR